MRCNYWLSNAKHITYTCWSEHITAHKIGAELSNVWIPRRIEMNYRTLYLKSPDIATEGFVLFFSYFKSSFFSNVVEQVVVFLLEISENIDLFSRTISTSLSLAIWSRVSGIRHRWLSQEQPVSCRCFLTSYRGRFKIGKTLANCRRRKCRDSDSHCSFRSSLASPKLKLFTLRRPRS